MKIPARKLVEKVNFLKDLWENRQLIWDMTKRDLKVRYLGSYLGIFWAFVQPAVTILIMWFVFQVGFKAQPMGRVPFILWLSAGMIPWFFLSEAISASANSIVENSFLVKKVVFRVSILPVVKLASAFLIHGFFLVVLAGMFLTYGYTPDVYWLQTVYYVLASVFLLLSLSWITSAVVIFIKDLGNVIAILLQFLFWGTPIFWEMSIVPEKYRFLFQLNPLYYLIKGYRDAFINKVWFWHEPGLLLTFWLEALLIFIIGVIVFKKLRPHFADVL